MLTTTDQRHLLREVRLPNGVSSVTDKTRRLLRPNCFQSVGNITLKELPRWQDLLRWETKSKNTPKPVAFGPRSVVLLKYRNTNENLTVVLDQLVCCLGLGPQLVALAVAGI